MKKLIMMLFLTLLSTSAFTRVEAVRKCLNRAMIKSMNMKLQNLTQNNSIDEEITFSCSNINSKGKHELLSIKQDKIKAINETLNKLAKNGSVRSYDFALLNADLKDKDISMSEMCPTIESNYEDQLKRVANVAFSSDLKKCPKTRDQFHAEYFNIMSSTDIVKMPIMDACSSLVSKIKQLKEQFQDRCNGNISEKPKLKKFGRFDKLTKAPTDAQILQVKILKAFKLKKSKYLV